MKKTFILLILAALIIQGFSQETSAENKSVSVQKAVADTNENYKVVIGRNLLVYEDSQAATNLRLGNRGISILESLEGERPRIEFEDYRPESTNNDYQEDDSRDNGARRFRGHWSGLEFGFNNYSYSHLLSDTELPDEIAYMKLHTGKSHSINISFSQVSLGITRNFGLVTGLGINWNNYRFANPNNIAVGDDGYIVEVIPDGELTVKRSKFSVVYLNVPALLEFQLPTGEGHRLNVAGGVIGGIKLGSHTKIVFDDGQKLKSDDDLNLSLLRGGVTARIGYENFMIYGTYYLTPWFKDQKGPSTLQLEPFEIGFAFTFND
ncbi:MAG: outer membrane beta-barrel protein [Bacteroidales bacterium]|nr:outer membrane beta-barrel protein [Bacteroidales bacterium]